MFDLDKSKFGYKMLQKMGWSEGKGLGASEDGGLEHVKVKIKCDTTGNDSHIVYTEILGFIFCRRQVSKDICGLIFPHH